MRHFTFLALLAAACGPGLAKDTTICPEYRDLRCASGYTCTPDSARRCRVCQCDAMRMEEVRPPDLPEPN